MPGHTRVEYSRGRNSKRVPSEYDSRALRLRHLSRYEAVYSGRRLLTFERKLCCPIFRVDNSRMIRFTLMIYQIIRHHILNDNDFHGYNRENLKLENFEMRPMLS
jgi:hypothetical protein